jgi:hypothetical protein
LSKGSEYNLSIVFDDRRNRGSICRLGVPMSRSIAMRRTESPNPAQPCEICARSGVKIWRSQRSQNLYGSTPSLVTQHHPACRSSSASAFLRMHAGCISGRLVCWLAWPAHCSLSVATCAFSVQDSVKVCANVDGNAKSATMAIVENVNPLIGLEWGASFAEFCRRGECPVVAVSSMPAASSQQPAASSQQPACQGYRRMLCARSAAASRREP